MSKAMSKVMLNRKLHKWISLFVGLQLLIWLMTGLYFNVMDHEKASGNVNRQLSEMEYDLTSFEIYPIHLLSVDSPEIVSLIWILDKPYYSVVIQKQAHAYQKQQTLLFDAVNGESYELELHDVNQIAVASYKGSANVETTELLTPPIAELPSERNSVWKVTLVDELHTAIYVSHATGEVIAHVTDDRRLRDFMFMLHFMDYSNQGSFNHWLIIAFSLMTLLLAVTGTIWVIQLIKEKQYRIQLFSHSKKTVLIQTTEATKAKQYSLNTRKTVLEGLFNINIALPSSCGGGGTCGQCKFVAQQILPLSHSEQVLLTDEEKNQHIRLGCQHQLAEVDAIKLPQR